ncbi:MAG: hypothetical protein PHC88_13995 [Terrimicrobiaceae bacterium]|nr:hypothetical protein [Terrimicrobiaceae bacterium]
MKRLPLLALCGAATALFPLIPLSAQTQGDAGPPPGGPPPHRMSIEERLDRMKKDLSLSDDQIGKLKAIFDEQKTALDPIFQDKSLSREQKREKAKPIMEDTKKKINEVLTPEQQTKLEAIRKQHQEQRKEKQKDN